MKNIKFLQRFLLGIFGVSLLVFTSCDDDVPPAEDEEEIITDVILTFSSGSSSVTASAQDPDGEGPQDLAITEHIVLAANTEYIMTIELENSIEGERITEEVEKEGDAHMFFFAFTMDIFSSPAGVGNMDDRAGAVNYNDQDLNGQPIGLSSTWTTGDAASGTFQLVLKHQPDLKSATSTSTDGSSDIDLTWNITIQ
jgi:hypothetical protein